MKPIRTFTVTPSLPPALERLRPLAYNLYWSWNHDLIELFRRLDSDLWEAINHNPVLMLGAIDQTHLEAAAGDMGFLAHLDRAYHSLQEYLAGESYWFRRTRGTSQGPLAAYFSAEFGVTECLSIFAGGLGVLAGDHLKSASDLGIPLVGIGLLYQQGYFHQYLNEAGWQQEIYQENDFHNLPLALHHRPNGTPVTVTVPYPGRLITARVWRVQVGRVELYLLDTNIPQNQPDDRRITHQLYGGDLDMRIKQEIMLGVGGYRALEIMGLEPTVYHINEGHTAFAALDRIRRLMETQHLSFDEAREVASTGLIFTIHTSAWAGHDAFPADLVYHYFADYTQRLGLSRGEFLALGRQNPYDDHEPFCMTILALRLASSSNGVSRLHGQVSRRTWQSLWPAVPEDEIPIGHVTNGVHFQSWISYEMNQLYDRYLGPRWKEEPANQTVWQRAQHIAPEELWRTHERRRERLVSFARSRIRWQLERRGAPQTEVEAAVEILDPEALTIGFARRFTTYKRATLILTNRERLARLLNAPGRPVQLIFAGKAHPHDDPAKELIRQIITLTGQEEFRRRVVFLEEYDMTVARYLVQGVDVWLGTSLRYQEPSGISGMKAAANGVLNLSILDGWWNEAYHPEIGWAIGRGEQYKNLGEQDYVEAEALYGLLERDVVPTFYERGPDGLPRRWIAYMKASLSALCHSFNTHRMVLEYTERFYVPAATRYQQLTADNVARAKALAAWRSRIVRSWGQVRIDSVETEPFVERQVGDEVRVWTQIHLGELKPTDVLVQLYLGRVNAEDEIMDGQATPMQAVGAYQEECCLFEATAPPCQYSGRHGYTVRVLPYHPDLTTSFVPGLIVWASA